jgi:hypothetical protein
MSETQQQPDRLLQRLLGPTGPELTCEQCFDLLDVYVEAEVSGEGPDARVPGMRAHLSGCPACSEEHDSLLALAASE